MLDSIVKNTIFKLVLFTAILFLARGEAKSVVETHEVGLSSATIVVISVSSGTAIQMDTSANLLPGRFAVEIYTDDATDNLFCGFSSTGTVTLTAGSRRIPARSSWVVQVGQAISIFCLSDGSGSVSTAFTQLR